MIWPHLPNPLAVADGKSLDITAGSAHMESYLQAWHELPDEKVWLFLGTYLDEVKYVPGRGWQIVRMTLRQDAGETRPMDKAVAEAKR